MNSLMDQLHDIEGLDSIDIWPLASAWWVIIGLGLLVLLIIIGCLIRWITFKRSWKNDALQKLALLEKNLSDMTARQTVVTLSEYIRRIVLKKFPRKDCASLVGLCWLKWLALHDPQKFDWEKKGVLLIEVPYAPLNKELSAFHIKELIQAAKNWVH